MKHDAVDSLEPCGDGDEVRSCSEFPKGTRSRGVTEEDFHIIVHLYGMKLRHKNKAKICDAAAQLVGLLPMGSLQLTNDSEQALKGDVNHLGIRLTASDHVVNQIDKLASDKPIFRDVVAYLVHE